MATLKQSVRTLSRSRWYSITVAAVIALCVALSTTVFAVVDGVLFRPLPYRNSSELYFMNGAWTTDALNSGVSISPRNARDWTAAVPGASMTLLDTGLNDTVFGDIRTWAPITARVDKNFFNVLGVQPLLGGFAADDFVDGAYVNRAVIISHAVWQDRFGGRPDIVGLPVQFDNRAGTFHIAGVTARAFVYPWMGQPPDILIAAGTSPAEQNDLRARLYTGLVRLPSSPAFTENQNRMNAAAAAEMSDWTPKPNDARGAFDRVSLRSVEMMMTRPTKQTFVLAIGVALVLMFLGCINVSGLIAARIHERDREYRIRRSLGASPFTIARIIVAENAVVIGAGTMAGLALALPLLSITMRVIPASLGFIKAPHIDLRVAAFSVLLMCVAVSITSAWPIARAFRRRQSTDAGTGDRATRMGSLARTTVIGAQIALALPVTLAGALLVGSVLQLWRVDPGYDADKTILLYGHAKSTSTAERDATLDRIEERMRALPGVTAAGATQSPFGGGVMMNAFMDGYTVAIRPGFLSAMHPRLVSGRLLTDDEIRHGDSVALMTESAARRAFKGAPALGRQLKGFVKSAPRMFEVVGVIKDMRISRLDDTVGQILAPYTLVADSQDRFTLVVGTNQTDSVLPLVVDAARTSGADAAFVSVAAGDDLLRETVRLRRFNSWIFGVFAASALAIVAVGVLGLVAMTTSRRTREVGIRMALGSTPSAIIRLVVGEQLWAVAAGLVVGSALSAWGSKLVKAYVFHLTPTDGRIWLAAAAVTLIVAALAAALPAGRASRIHPAEALRDV